MNKKERIYNALSHQKVDKIPKGELAIDAHLANVILDGKFNEDFQDFDREIAIRKLLNIDYINIGEWPGDKVGMQDGIPVYKSIYGELYSHNGISKHIEKSALDDIEESVNYKVPDISRVSGKLVHRFATESDMFLDRKSVV